jgi:hypothetical protein
MITPMGGDRRHQDDVRDMIAAVEKKAEDDLARGRRDLLEEMQEHRSQHREAHTRLRDSFKELEERQNSLSRELAAQRDKLTTYVATPIEASKLHLTTGQMVGVISITIFFATAQVTQLVRGEMQIMLQNERAATLTKTIDDVVKAQKMAELNRLNDLKEIRQLIAEQKGQKP